MANTFGPRIPNSVAELVHGVATMMRRPENHCVVQEIHRAERKSERSLLANAWVPKRVGPNVVALVKEAKKTPKKEAMASRVVKKRSGQAATPICGKSSKKSCNLPRSRIVD